MTLILHLHARIDEPTIELAAVLDAKMVGFARVWVDGFDDCTAPTLTDLYVHKQYRREGIGSALVRQAITLTGPSLAAYVHPNRTESWRLFRALDFRCLPFMNPGGEQWLQAPRVKP